MKKILIIYLVFLLLINCKRDSTINLNSEDQIKNQKDFWINKYGDVDSTEIGIHDFVSATECRVCHSEYVEEWSRSRHALSFSDPIFQKGLSDARVEFPITGENFCIQCHSPIAYVTGASVNSFSIINEGVTCTVCHSFSGLGETVNVSNDVAANANVVALAGLSNGNIASYNSDVSYNKMKIFSLQ